MATKFEYYSDGSGITDWSEPFWNGNSGGDFSYQTFTPQVDYVISSVRVYWKKVDLDNDFDWSWTLSIVTTSGGTPTSTSIASASFAFQETPFDWTWVEFEFGTPVALTAETMYAIRVIVDGGSSDHPIQWARRTTANYTRGTIWHHQWGTGGDGVYPGALSEFVAEGDFFFETWGTGAPSKAVNPTPTDTNSNVTLDHDTIIWEDGGGADTFDVYYGTTSGSLTLVSSAQAGTSFTIWGVSDGSPYDYLDIRYWRIDSTNEAGTTTGDEWMFTTIPLTYPNPSPTPPDPDYPYPPDHDFNPNFINTTQRLICAANSKVWYEV